MLAQLGQLLTQHSQMVHTSALSIKDQVHEVSWNTLNTSTCVLTAPLNAPPQLNTQWEATSGYVRSQQTGLSSLSSAIEQEKLRQDKIVRELQESLRLASEKQEQLKMVRTLLCVVMY